MVKRVMDFVFTGLGFGAMTQLVWYCYQRQVTFVEHFTWEWPLFIALSVVLFGHWMRKTMELVTFVKERLPRKSSKEQKR